MEGNVKAEDDIETTSGGEPGQALGSASGSGGSGAVVVKNDYGTSA